MKTATQTHPQFDAVAAFPLGNVVDRYIKDHKVASDVAKLHEQELKRYLFVCAKYPEHGWPMILTLDELWHTFIIFTKEYHEFCRHLGVPYIHHQPFVDGEDTSGIKSAYTRFLDLYRMEFGDPDPKIWPSELTCDCASCGSGCSGGGCSGAGCGSSCGSSCR